MTQETLVTAGDDIAKGPHIDPKELRRACGAFATGVTVITARQGGAEHGMTANAFMSVSLDPPLIVVSVSRKARLLSKVEAGGRYGVSILAEHMEPVAWHFAGKPNPALKNLFEDFHGLPVIRGAVAHFAARLHQAVDGGDHVLFIGAIEGIARAEGKPLIFHEGQFVKLLPHGWSAAKWPLGSASDPEGYFDEAPDLW
jgi:flavin reductase (DIM6/NTAB) family NADH-FMN oxidoreductase RutF